jgi:hypothetical protein
VNQLLSAIHATADEVRRLRAELETVEQRLRTLRRAAGLPAAPSPEPSAPVAQATRLRSDDAKDWLRAALNSGPLPAREIRERGASVGLSWRTLQRTAKALRVAYTRHDFGPTTHTVWALPQGGNA